MSHRPLLLACFCMSLACEASAEKRPARTSRAGLNLVWEACRHRDAEQLWSSANDGFRKEFDSRAAELAASLSTEELRLGFPSFRGERAEFRGRAYLAALLASDDRAKSPCFGASAWQLTRARTEEGQHAFELTRPDGYEIEFRFERQNGNWRLSGVSKPVRRQEPAASAPCSWDGHYRFVLSWHQQPACELGPVPRQVEVYVRVDDAGRPSFMPKGRQPTDALQGAKCELEFDGMISGLPKGRRLTLEFEERGGQVLASGRYSRVEDSSAAGSQGCSVAVAVNASRVPLTP